jgi:uncharacterized membrane protein
VSYDDFVSNTVKVVEAAGAALMVLGGLYALVIYVMSLSRSVAGRDPYRQLRSNLGRAILLGLEVLIVGDIVRTIVVEPTFESVGVLGVIVLIRIALSFSLEVEIDGTWPWNRRRTDRSGPSGGSNRLGPSADVEDA